MTSTAPTRAAVVGAGPAGLMAAEILCNAGLSTDLYEATGSVGRKFLLAGKGGLNLTHSEPPDRFVLRYADRREAVARWLKGLDPLALRQWARNLGVETFVGSSGRVFPLDLKAAPLLRSWVRRLRTQGLRFHLRHRLDGWEAGPGSAIRLHLRTADHAIQVDTDVLILALGGASWPQLGTDGRWAQWMAHKGLAIAPLEPANCGFDIDWSPHLKARYAGQPVKPVVMRWVDLSGSTREQQGEFVLTRDGVEGSLIYAAARELRETIKTRGQARVELDLKPGQSPSELATRLARPRKGRSIGEHLRRTLDLDGARAGLLFEVATPVELADPGLLAGRIKCVPLHLLRPRPLAEAISTAGGLRLDELDEDLMLRRHPGVFCAGEMLDWEAPTGGYLFTASFASGAHAARAAIRWLAAR